MVVATGTFDNVFVRSTNQLGLSVVLLLAWIASCDGSVSHEEEQALRQLAAGSRNENEVDAVLAVARQKRAEDLQLACEVIRHLDRKGRRLFLQMAVGMSLADGYLVTSENHVLRFLADVLDLGQAGLHAVFAEMTGDRFPMPGNPSSVAWWKERETSQSGETSGAQGSSQATESLDLSRLRDLATLGLDEEADREDIRQAYLRMAKIHHPDRFNSLGPEAVRAAESTFRRIQGAYERLGVA